MTDPKLKAEFENLGCALHGWGERDFKRGTSQTYTWQTTQRAWEIFKATHERYAPDATRFQKLLRCFSAVKLSFDRKTGRVNRLRPDIKTSVITSDGYRDELRRTIDEFTPEEIE